MNERIDVAVVGGGLSGLAAGALAARAGARVTLFEKASALGGRAATTHKEGFLLNLGAHALYRNGAAERVLQKLQVAYAGKMPSTSGIYAAAAGALHTFPSGALSLLTTGLLSAGAKLAVAKTLARLGSIDPAPWRGTSASAWLHETLPAKDAREAVAAFMRVSTYTGDLDTLSAGAALAQMAFAAKHNVRYLDGGWETLVHGVRDAALAAGATLEIGAGIAKIIQERDGFAIALRDGTHRRAHAVVLATGPHAAAALAPQIDALAQAAARAVPVKVAALDLALRRLPRPRACLALGTDRPTYVSVHSTYAALAPEGGAVVHALHYLPSGDANADENELANAVELLQPGAAAEIVQKRFLPSILVLGDIVSAARGGLAGRQSVEVSGAPGLFLAGDWIGSEGMLTDAALASAERAAALAVGHARGASAAQAA